LCNIVCNYLNFNKQKNINQNKLIKFDKINNIYSVRDTFGNSSLDPFNENIKLYKINIEELINLDYPNYNAYITSFFNPIYPIYSFYYDSISIEYKNTNIYVWKDKLFIQYLLKNVFVFKV
jgi:hypothetical protein